MNILCAALIRYPWKKRQTGFVVTHVGLLTLLAGSFYSVRTADEGQVGMIEGDVKSELVRSDHPVIRIWEVDPHTRERTRELRSMIVELQAANQHLQTSSTLSPTNAVELTRFPPGGGTVREVDEYS